jgi:hypothetical protein
VVSYVCPNGFNLSNNSCNKTLTEEPLLKCDDDWTRSGSTCSRVISAGNVTSCPNSLYVKSGTTCSWVQTDAIDYSCPSSWRLDGTTCRNELVERATIFCNASYGLKGGLCEKVISEEIVYECPTGWSRDGVGCDRTVTDEIDFYCVDDANALNADSCVRKSPSPAVGLCPSDFNVNQLTGACEKNEFESVIFSCPTSEDGNYELNAGLCNFLDTTAVKTKCGDDATLSEEGEICTLPLQYPAIPSCELTSYIPIVSENRCMLEERVPFGQ